MEAFVRALKAPNEVVGGEVFTISDGDDLTWASFSGFFANALGMQLRTISDEEFERRQAKQRKQRIGNWIMAPYRGVRDVARSTELRALAKRVLKYEPLYSVARHARETYPGRERPVRRLWNLDLPPIYRPSQRPVQGDVLEFDLTCPLVDITKARRVLGYSPMVPRERAMEQTLQWLKHGRII